jgi:hypothetical protein
MNECAKDSGHYRQAAPAGRSSCWPVRWSISLTTRACCMRRFGGAWLRTTSNPGARTCGAFRGSMANTSPAWRTCLISTPRRPIPSGRRCASTNPVQLIGETSQPGRLEGCDYEYCRNGTVNHASTLAQGQSYRAAEDYAKCMRDLVDVPYRDAETIRVVQDNLSTHSAGARIGRSRPPKPRESRDASSSTTLPNTQAGSTWSRSRSASCGGNA